MAQPNAQLVIVASDQAKMARLQIPRKVLKALQSLPAGGLKGAGLSVRHTMTAGLALALALAFGGLWIVRRTSGAPCGGTRKLTAPLCALALVGLLGAGVLADRAIPRRPKPRPHLVLMPDLSLTGPVVVEVVEQGRFIKLIAPRSMMGQFAQKAAPKPR